MNKTTFIEKCAFDDPVGTWYLCFNCQNEVFLTDTKDVKFCPYCGDKIEKFVDPEIFQLIDWKDILTKLGLYNTPWTPFESVIKDKATDYTILVKYKNQDWEWYNQQFFMDIVGNPNDKQQLLDLLKPVDGPEDEISEG